jgi:hypothetical protein
MTWQAPSGQWRISPPPLMASAEHPAKKSSQQGYQRFYSLLQLALFKRGNSFIRATLIRIKAQPSISCPRPPLSLSSPFQNYQYFHLKPILQWQYTNQGN